jgi:6-phosphogluconolactonase
LKNSPKPPKGRITISKKLLLKSKVGLVLFIGEIKRDAYNNFRNKSLSYESCPAKLVESIGESYIITDLD